MASTSQTEHALYMFTRTFDRYKHESFLNLRTFSDGLPFANMILSIPYFDGIIDDLQLNAEKWTQKLANLKKMLTKMESYVESQGQKSLKINDLELVEIAKNNSQQEILKLFEVVIAVLMQTPQKQDYIQRIMGLDERSQQALVIVVQNAMQERISEHHPTSTKAVHQSIQQLTGLQNENLILTQQINELCKQNEALFKKNNDLQQKLQEYQQEVQKARNLNIEMYMNTSSKASEIERENSLIETLKKKMIEMTRQHQLELGKTNDEIYHLKGKLSHYKDIEEELMERNKMLEDRIKNFTSAVEEERKRLDKNMDQKEAKIKKLQFELEMTKNKIRQLSEDIEVNDLNLRMELQRKQVRFKQLQKEVKNRLIEPSMQLPKRMSVEQSFSPQKIEENEEQLEFLKSEVDKLRNTSRQLERENLKLKKKSEKVTAMQNEKKKLEKIILDVSKCRDSQIEMLIVSLYDLRNQNIRMHEIIKQLRYREESKYQ